MDLYGIKHLIERFERNCTPEPNSGCWLWLGAEITGGYGRFKIGERAWVAHRMSWEIYRGPVPDGLFVLHRCDNPACVNPDHLFLGTQQRNRQDCVSKGRQGRHGVAVARLSFERAQKIRECVCAGMTKAAAAREFNTSRSNVLRIVRGESWVR